MITHNTGGRDTDTIVTEAMQMQRQRYTACGASQVRGAHLERQRLNCIVLGPVIASIAPQVDVPRGRQQCPEALHTASACFRTSATFHKLLPCMHICIK